MAMLSGEFHGEMTVTTPLGWRSSVVWVRTGIAPRRRLGFRYLAALRA